MTAPTAGTWRRDGRARFLCRFFVSSSYSFSRFDKHTIPHSFFVLVLPQFQKRRGKVQSFCLCDCCLYRPCCAMDERERRQCAAADVLRRYASGRSSPQLNSREREWLGLRFANSASLAEALISTWSSLSSSSAAAAADGLLDLSAVGCVSTHGFALPVPSLSPGQNSEEERLLWRLQVRILSLSLISLFSFCC